MRILDWFLDLLYPKRCAFCHKLIEGENPVCRECSKKLPYALGIGQEQQLAHGIRCYSPLYYEGYVRDSLLRYKFHSAVGYAEVYAEFLSKCIDENEISCDSITWVPLSRRRLRSRGYDQARLLAEALARKCALPCGGSLRKLRNNPAQSRSGNAARRKANVSGIYAPLDEASVDGKRLLLVDDIVTTGATLLECAKELKSAGAKEVTCITVARSRE